VSLINPHEDEILSRSIRNRKVYIFLKHIVADKPSLLASVEKSLSKHYDLEFVRQHILGKLDKFVFF
jgi:hypothetical protein